jgi:hypothetical protein
MTSITALGDANFDRIIAYASEFSVFEPLSVRFALQFESARK